MFGKFEQKKNVDKQKIDRIIFNYIRYGNIYDNISQNEKISKTTIRRILKRFKFDNVYNDKIQPTKDIIYMDTIYFKWVWSLTIFNSWYYRKPIYWIWSDTERKQIYIEWIKFLMNKWWIIKWVVMDIMRWLKNYLESKNIPVQYCIFHQQKNIRKYLTKRLKLEQNKELKEISFYLWKFNYNTIKQRLNSWFNRNINWLNEKNDKWHYVHEKTRKAYNSLIRNLDNLYTYEKYSNLWFEKTNNLSEWINSSLRSKTNIHRWVRPRLRKKLINHTLYHR